MNIAIERTKFAEVIKNTLKGDDRLHFGSRFMKALFNLNPDLIYPSRISDRSLNAAWNFCDRYFDAIAHGFSDCGGMPMSKAAQKMDEIVISLSAGGEITDDEVMQFYYKPAESPFTHLLSRF